MKLLLALLPTIALVVYGQLMVKWRVKEMSQAASSPDSGWERLMGYLLDPHILSSYVAALLSSITWMFVVERYPVSLAFPIHIGLTLSIVVLGGIFLLDEQATPAKIIGVAFIAVGVAIGSRS